MPKVAFSDFVRRQTPESEFSHWECHDEALIRRVLDNFDKAKKGYRDGVLVVPIPSKGIYSPVVNLKEGDILTGAYKARRPGEEPRKTLHVKRADAVMSKTAAVSCDVILYRHDVLAENNEQSSDAEWEIIAVNAHITDEDVPIQPNTLIANHFELDGGTSTGMSPEEFESALRKSVLFWKDKAMLEPPA